MKISFPRNISFRAFLTWLRNFGKNHFTVMMIPHSEKKIFTFQVSNYIIAFIILLTALTSWSVYNYNVKKKKLLHDLDKVQKINREYWKLYNSYEKQIKDNLDYFEEYSGEIENILDVFGVEKDDVWEYTVIEDSRQVRKKLKLKYGRSYHEIPDNVYQLHRLTQKLEATLAHLENIDSVITIRDDLFSHIPSRWPIYGDKGYKTSPYGVRYSPFEGKNKFHTGVDIAAYPRTPILAAADGQVSFAGVKSGYGYTVIINHKYGYKTLYGHNARVLVYNGQRVRKGQKIALLGKSGRATGFHVHFEIRINNKPVDPWPFITTEM